MKHFICSMADNGKHRQCGVLTSNLGEVELFAEKHDQPGRSVYSCVNPLKDTATRRCKDDVAAIVLLHADVDYKRLTTPPDEIRETVLSLPFPFEVRDSGGGLHIIAHLKESYESGSEHFQRAERLRDRIVELLAADPAPNHSAALLRVLGTHNYKYGEPRRVCILQSGEPVDLTDIEAFLDLYSTPLFELKDENSNVTPLDNYVPVDADAFLSDTPTTGEAINALAHRVMRALIVREGYTPQESFSAVVDAIMEMARTHHPDWTYEEEVKCATPRMNWVLRCLQEQHWKAVEAGHLAGDSAPDWLPPEWQQTWIEVCQAGLKPNIARNHHGWFVRRPPTKNNNVLEETIDAAERLNTVLGSAIRQPRVRRKPHLKDVALSWWKPIDPTTFPPREWLYGRHYQRGVVCGTIAPGGTGKTSLCMVEAIAMATARNLLGEQPKERLRVWYHNAEDKQDEVERRVLAICQYYKIPQEELEGWFIATSSELFDLKVANGYHELRVDERVVNAMADKIHAMEIDVVMLDPLVNLHATTEQDNGRMNAVVGVFRDIAQTEGCAIEIEQHTRKPPIGAGDVDYNGSDARGASAVRDAFRAQRVLNHMSKAEAAKHHIPEHERTLYIRVDLGKANNSRPQESVWRQLKSVELPNTDSVGVIVPWQCRETGASAAIEQKAQEMFLLLLTQWRASGRYASDAKQSKYAPKVFAATAAAKAANFNVYHFENAMAALFEAGRICLVSEMGSDRHLRSAIVPLGEPTDASTD
jgi:hypothetical protein